MFLTSVPRNALGEAVVDQPEDRVEVVRLDDTAIITAEAELGVHHVYSMIGSDEQGRATFLHNSNAPAQDRLNLSRNELKARH